MINDKIHRTSKIWRITLFFKGLYDVKKTTLTLTTSILIKKLESLCDNFDVNQEEICACEKDLNDLTNNEVVAKVKQMKIFDCLNNEKPTLFFLVWLDQVITTRNWTR
jgi:hypothetical protein